MHKWDARDYQKSSEVQLKWARELIAKLDLKGNERVLDIGCGDGKITAELAGCVPEGRVIGIDSSAEMIALACETFDTDSFLNLRFLRMDARELTFLDEFDVVFSNAALHWVDDHFSVLSGISRGLRSGGRVLLQMGGKGNAADMMTVISSMLREERWSSYFGGFTVPYSFYGIGEYREWLTGAGLEPLRVELIPKDMTQQGREGLMAWFRTTWHPFIQSVPDELQQKFIDEAIDTYLSEHPVDDNGLAHLGMVRLEVEAVKNTKGA